MSIGLLNHYVKKGSKISGGNDGPGPEPIPPVEVDRPSGRELPDVGLTRIR